MAGPPRPALYRASRYVSLAATLVALLLVLYVGLVIYSASQIKPGSGGGTGIEQNVTSAGFELTAVVNFSNPGFLPITKVHLSSVVELPNGGGILARGTSPNISIAPGSVGRVPLTMVVPFASDPSASMLLTQDAQLPSAVFANVSLSGLFSIRVEIPTNISWGAPFANLTLTPGAPTNVNGSVVVPLSLSFNDHASFPVGGVLSLTLEGTGGSNCDVAATPFTISASSHGSDSSSSQVTAPAGCSFPKGTPVSGTFSSSSWSANLPPETLP
jgi:hypothetical protein